MTARGPILPLVRPGATCWRIERARHVALLIDNQSAFAAVRSALRRAQRSVMILGWEFDPRTRLCAESARADEGDRIGDALRGLAARRPEVDIRVLVWDMPLPISVGRGRYRHRAYRWFEGSRVQLRFDDRHPPGACHHQKLVVVDDALAFCSGGDFAPNRWDSSAHLDRDTRRRLPSGKLYLPRHEVTIALDGAAAAALGELARMRWSSAGGQTIRPPARSPGNAWPKALKALLTRCPVAIARTHPAHGARAAIRENERLYLAGIAAARRLIYLENQYLTSPVIGKALERRLRERDGPEIIVIIGRRSPSYFDRLTMDAPREELIAHLHAADRHGRFRAYTPVTAGGRDIVVHAKLMIVDDRLLRAGSANLSSRSMGFDTECDLAIDAALARGTAARTIRGVIARFLHRLVGHYVAASPASVARAIHRQDGLAAAIEALQRPGVNRLRRLRGQPPRLPRSMVAKYHLGDPQGPADALRPWRRRAGPTA